MNQKETKSLHYASISYTNSKKICFKYSNLNYS